MRLLTRCTLAVCAMLVLTACEQQKKLTAQEVKAVDGMTQEEARARLGIPTVITNGGEIAWWQYDGVDDNGITVSCHFIIKGGRVEKVGC